MAYKTKQELEEGSYIVYTDEPGMIYDDSGSGGGGADFGKTVKVAFVTNDEDTYSSFTYAALGLLKIDETTLFEMTYYNEYFEGGAFEIVSPATVGFVLYNVSDLENIEIKLYDVADPTAMPDPSAPSTTIANIGELRPVEFEIPNVDSYTNPVIAVVIPQ